MRWMYIWTAAIKKGTYNAITNNILLPTNYPSSDDFETMAAHELFHTYQDAVWNEVKGIGKNVQYQ